MHFRGYSPTNIGCVCQLYFLFFELAKLQCSKVATLVDLQAASAFNRGSKYLPYVGNPWIEGIFFVSSHMQKYMTLVILMSPNYHQSPGSLLVSYKLHYSLTSRRGDRDNFASKKKAKPANSIISSKRREITIHTLRNYQQSPRPPRKREPAKWIYRFCSILHLESWLVCE